MTVAKVGRSTPALKIWKNPQLLKVSRYLSVFKDIKKIRFLSFIFYKIQRKTGGISPEESTFHFYVVPQIQRTKVAHRGCS